MKKEVSALSIGVQGVDGVVGGELKPPPVLTRIHSKPRRVLFPSLALTLWEHAYYVDYRNVRPNYVNAIWDVINWDTVEERLVKAKSG
eukprot:CCRYP_017188-RA/>CCRYP_017188-RA protein AED:0.21 eAED:0.21 QI:0/0.5/0.66/1/0.5/0/3/1223/87